MDAVIARFFPYKIPFRERNRMREGLLLELEKDGKKGWGEIAPLPHWNQETLEESKAQLENILPLLIKDQEVLSHFPLYPSVRFGTESALAELQEPVSSAISLPLSGLLLGTPREILKQAEKLKEEGIQTVKLKVSSLSFEDAKKLILELKNHFLLRIDVNRAWDFEDSVRFFNHFSPEIFEYIEEPVKKSEDLLHFKYPFAIDESFWKMDTNNLKNRDLTFLKALIVKPTMWGNLSLTSKLPVKIVLSSCYETAVGLHSIAQIARKLSLLSYPHGLDTGRYLSKDVVKEPLKISHGYLHFPAYLEITEEFRS